MRIFYYILFVFLMVALMSGRSLADPEEEDEDDWEGGPAGGAGNVDDVEGGTPNVHLYGGGK